MIVKLEFPVPSITYLNLNSLGFPPTIRVTPVGISIFLHGKLEFGITGQSESTKINLGPVVIS